MEISIKAARVNAGYTQKYVCETVNISKTTLCNYEKGRTIPDLLTAQKLAKLYNMPLDKIKFF